MVETLQISSHNHSQYLLLYKVAVQLLLSLGRFRECRKCNILVTYNTGTCALPDMCTYPRAMRMRPRMSCIYIRQNTLACVITYTYYTLIIIIHS